MTDKPVNVRMRVEILLAYPPTSKCKMLKTIIETFVEENPDLLRLDVYYAGSQPFVVPTKGYQSFSGEDKYKKIPSAYVNGRLVADGTLPDIDELRKNIIEELKKGPAAWDL